MKLINLEGKRFGRLQVLPNNERKSGRVYWECLCECGNKLYVQSSHLISGHTKSCGCYKYESLISANTKHGGRNTRLYSVWSNMKNRCTNVTGTSSKYYALKGIEVCDEWASDFGSFMEWAYKNGWVEQPSSTPYKDLLSIDRIDSSVGYCPSNCRIISVSENSTEANLRRWNRLKQA